MNKKRPVGVVYSTDPNFQYQYEEEPEAETLEPSHQDLRVLRDAKGRGGKTVTLKLRWQSYSGMKQANFKFCSRKTTESANLLHGSPKFVTEIE